MNKLAEQQKRLLLRPGLKYGEEMHPNFDTVIKAEPMEFSNSPGSPAESSSSGKKW